MANARGQPLRVTDIANKIGTNGDMLGGCFESLYSTVFDDLSSIHEAYCSHGLHQRDRRRHICTDELLERLDYS